jgi:fibronectin type 3 domain-containing protein
MKKIFQVLLVSLLALCCLISDVPVRTAAGTLVVSTKSTTEDALAASANAKEIFRFLVYDMGFNSAAACGVLANMRKESYFNPQALGDNGTSYGICQWHDTSTGRGRYTNLVNWCSANGYDYTTLTGQLHFLQYELSRDDSGSLHNGRTIYDAMLAFANTSDGAYEAGYYWCNAFEVPYSNDAARREAECVARGTLARDTYWVAYCVPNMNGASLTSDGIALSWDTFEGASGYELYRYTNSDYSTMSLIATTADTVFTDTTVKSGNTYTYVLCAVILLPDQSSYTATAKEINQYYLAAPELTKCSGFPSGQKIQWKKVDGATEYIIFRSDDNSEPTRIASTSSTSYKDTTALTPGVRYGYQVYACHDDGTGEPLYSTVSNSIGNYTLAQPVITSVSTVESGIKVKWDKVSHAKSYSVYRSIDGGAYEEIATVTKKSFVDTDVSSSATIKYKIYAHFTGSVGQTS